MYAVNWYIGKVLSHLTMDGVFISWRCDVNYEASLFFIVDQYDVRLIVKQMLVSLDRKVPEDLGVVVPDHFFLVLLTSLYCAQDCT